jgi:hypothetical protein
MGYIGVVVEGVSSAPSTSYEAATCHPEFASRVGLSTLRTWKDREISSKLPPMKYLLAAVFALTFISVAAAQYPKTITLTVTRITRTSKATPTCDNCTTVTNVEAHTDTANFVLTCEATLTPGQPNATSYCVQFETGIHQAMLVSPSFLEFLLDDPVTKSGKATRVYYMVSVEEARTKVP